MVSKKAVPVLVAFLTLVFLCFCVQAGKRDEGKLRKGEILFSMEAPEKGGLPVFQARGVVGCSRVRVWAVINDYDNLQNIMPGIVEGRVERVDGNVVYFFQKDHVPVVEDAWYLLRCVHDDDHFQKTMSMVEGSVKSLEARWELEPFGEGKTLAVYTLQSDPGFYVPQWLQKMSLKRTITGFMEALRATACAGSD